MPSLKESVFCWALRWSGRNSTEEERPSRRRPLFVGPIRRCVVWVVLWGREGRFHGWVSSVILYLILNETGSQWRERRMGVMWSYFRTLDPSGAVLDVVKFSKALARSPEEEAKVWTVFFCIWQTECETGFGNVPEVVEGDLTQDHRHTDDCFTRSQTACLP